MKMKSVDLLKGLRRSTSASAADQDPSRIKAAADVSASPREAEGDGAESGDRWIGYIDHINDTVITGWCFDARDPARSLVVEVVASNGRRLTAIAEQFRQDVKEAGYGTGNYGFQVDVATLGLKDETLTIRIAESGVAINRVALSLDPQLGLLEGRLPPAVTRRMEALALDARTRFAELEERDRHVR